MIISLQDIGQFRDVLSITDITVGGILVVACVYLGWKLHKAEQKLRESENLRIEDMKDANEKLLATSDKMYNWMNQMKDIFKANG